jgi:shikimate dehydrogenase
MAADGAPVRGTTRLAGVMGWPVAHSRSPQMHNAAFAALGLDWVYVPLAVPEAGLERALRALPDLGFAGVNVTIPHKQRVCELCDTLSDEAARARSVNTVLVGEDGTLDGHTTDGRGMLGAIGLPLPDEALVVGSGGAARAAVVALRDAGLRVRVSARNREAAAELGAEVDPWPAERPAALLVNATPVGQAGPAEELPVSEELIAAADVVCDLTYRGDGQETGLVATAARHGMRVIDGLDVLVFQGVLAFQLFTGQEPPLEVMHAAVRGTP